MRETSRTILFAAVAGVLALGAVVLVPRHRAAAVFNDQGEAFYPNFKDPLAATSLEIAEYDETAASPRVFKVELRNGRWCIPSHHNYPVDAREQLAKTAESVIDLRKDAIRSDRTQDHEELGVADPLDGKATRGRGRHITFRDASGAVLADFIFGKETRDGSGMRFVRVPGQKYTYASKTKGQISGRFADWIETDLLKLSAASIRRITIDDYSVNLERGSVDRVATYFLARDEASTPWKLGDLKDKEEVNAETMNELVGALDDLKIVGVRPKPPGLTRELKATGEIPMTNEAAMSLQNKGFYLTRDGQLASNEGELLAGCDDGVSYTLRFGNILYGEGEEITSGTEDPKTPTINPKTGGTENRYLFVTASFDESALPAEPEPPKEVKPDPSRTLDQQKAEEERYRKEKEEYDKKKKERDDKVAAGRKRAQELTDRFADWYYVISADYFRKLRRKRPDLVKTVEPPKPPEPPKESPKSPEPPKETPKPPEGPREVPKPPEAPK